MSNESKTSNTRRVTRTKKLPVKLVVKVSLNAANSSTIVMAGYKSKVNGITTEIKRKLFFATVEDARAAAEAFNATMVSMLSQNNQLISIPSIKVGEDKTYTFGKTLTVRADAYYSHSTAIKVWDETLLDGYGGWVNDNPNTGIDGNKVSARNVTTRKTEIIEESVTVDCDTDDD